MTTNFYYDGNGARVRKEVVGESTTFYAGSLYEVKDGAATKYIFGADRRIAKITDGEGIQYFSKDHLGSSTVVTDDSGAVVEQADYRPFGEDRFYTGTVATPTPYKYTDQELDESTGLYNYDARHYDPAIGRFISPDSLIPNLYDPQQLNPYAYCRNNPLIYVDPTGHAAREPFSDPIEAAEDFSRTYNDDSIRNKREYSTQVYSYTNDKNETKYTYDYPTMGSIDESPPAPDEEHISTTKSFNHTHPPSEEHDSNRVSDVDKDIVRSIYRETGIVITTNVSLPNGYLDSFNPQKEESDPREGYRKGMEIIATDVPCDNCKDKKRNAWEMGPDDFAYDSLVYEAPGVPNETTESNMMTPVSGGGGLRVLVIPAGGVVILIQITQPLGVVFRCLSGGIMNYHLVFTCK